MEKVILVKLNDDQVCQAKEKNGQRKFITHSLICGEYGRLFGTEKQCRKYYEAWKRIFPLIFNGGEKTDKCEITNFNETFNLAMILIEKHDELERKNQGNFPISQGVETPKKKSIFSKMFRG